jgi:hypothetical protein
MGSGYAIGDGSGLPKYVAWSAQLRVEVLLIFHITIGGDKDLEGGLGQAQQCAVLGSGPARVWLKPYAPADRCSGYFTLHASSHLPSDVKQ